MGNTLKTTLLLATLSGLLLLIGDVTGGQSGLLIAFFFAAAMNFASYFWSDKIVLAMYRAKQVGPGHPLYTITGRLVQRAGLPMPKVYGIPDMSPNAFATGRNPQHAAVAATEGILRLMDPSEIEGVMAHELAHVKHRDILISSVAATIAAAIMMAARRSPDRRTAWRARCASWNRRASRFPWKRIRRRRTCSSSSRFRSAACS